MNNTPTLDQKIYDGLCEMALKTYQKDRRHDVIFFYFCPKGMAIMPVFGVISDAVWDSLKIHMRDQQVNSYVLVNEAYWQECNPLRMPKVRPKDDPMSIDVLIVSAVFPDGRKVVRAWEVDRGKVIKEREQKPELDVGGRFLALLDP